jgi:hypothetical protein
LSVRFHAFHRRIRCPCGEVVGRVSGAYQTTAFTALPEEWEV